MFKWILLAGFCLSVVNVFIVSSDVWTNGWLASACFALVAWMGEIQLERTRK